MTSPSAPTPASRLPLGKRNLLFLAAALVSLAAGYGVLLAGHASFAAVLLVLGYCVLFPLGIAL
jgi:hypothetical protein